jgi:predicted peptidase
MPILSLTLFLPSPSAREPVQSPPQAQPAEDRPAIASGFLFKSLKFEDRTYDYCVYVPPGYAPDRAWPVILFLHGSGEAGTDGFLQTDIGIGRAIRRDRSRIPAIVVMPQCRPKQRWLGRNLQMALRCVEETSKEYRLDPDRVYLTGLSLGGQGTWHLAAQLPDRFAAIVPICGFAELGPDTTAEAAKLAAKLTNVPIWCFHGDADTAVPVTKSREMVDAIRKAGGKAEYTEVKGGQHNVWDRAYEDPALWTWLFAQKRGSTP